MHDQMAVMIAAVDCRNNRETGETFGTLQAKENGGQSLNYMGAVRTGCSVRRLTPLECERLQGYPDGWTDIPGASDSARYKALGNSIALPFWRWMLTRMSTYLPADATLGSLFDGIGGFPLIWEETHGKGTARWASEIEPFPIAVTKYHLRRAYE
jgi:DNA (cytosine-5)-methyltransferase 1